MDTRCLEWIADEPDPDVLALAAETIRAGGLVAFPTETVYGLGADALQEAAVERIYKAKGRPSRNPLIVHVLDIAHAQKLGEWNKDADRLAKSFWPGPLTLILQKKSIVPDIVTGGGTTVALRSPDHPVARGLIEASGTSLAAPSANRSQRLSPTTAQHVLADLDGRIDLVLDGGRTPRGIESTVIDLTTTPTILRPGPISASTLESVLGIPVRRESRSMKMPSEIAAKSPGMMDLHYAPRTLLELRSEAEVWVKRLLDDGLRIAWLGFEAGSPIHSPNLQYVAMPTDPDAYSNRLYFDLHDVDRMLFDRIVVSRPPDEDEWAGVLDRLRRASSKR